MLFFFKNLGAWVQIIEPFNVNLFLKKDTKPVLIEKASWQNIESNIW